MEFSAYYGELAAILTSFLWSITALSFEVASKRIGALSVNILRMILAFIFLSLFNWFSRGFLLPTDASAHAWTWLALSGLIGFVFGDYFLLRAFMMVSSRITMLVMTLVPPITALIGWLFLGEVMTGQQVLAMFIVVSGIGMAVFSRDPARKRVTFSYPVKGLFFAFLGTVGQAVGLVMSKYGMQDYNAFAASQIRIIVGMIGFAVIILVLRKQQIIRQAVKDRKGMKYTVMGAFFGPFLGVSFSLLAVKYTQTGIAATLMSLMPIILIPPSILLFKNKVTWLEILGAFISIAGVTIFFW